MSSWSSDAEWILSDFEKTDVYVRVAPSRSVPPPQQPRRMPRGSRVKRLCVELPVYPDTVEMIRPPRR